MFYQVTISFPMLRGLARAAILHNVFIGNGLCVGLVRS